VTRTRRWVLDGEARSLREAIERCVGDDVDAIAAGRVFVNGRRRREPLASVERGDVLEVVEPRTTGGGAVSVIANRDGIVVVDKPAGIPTEPDRRGGSDSVVEAVARQLQMRSEGLHAASRLDLGVSGLVLLAATRAARQRIASWRSTQRLSRRYVALGSGVPTEPSGAWEGTLSDRDARPAATRYRLVATVTPSGANAVSLVALQPATGRFHQLRVHSAAAGMPLLGDPAHGGPRRIVGGDGRVLGFERIGLHSLWVEVDDRGERLRWVAPVPEMLAMWWKRLGGHPEAWSTASECSIP